MITQLYQNPYTKIVLRSRIIHITFAAPAKIPHLLSHENLQKIRKITGQMIKFPSTFTFSSLCLHTPILLSLGVSLSSHWLGILKGKSTTKSLDNLLQLILRSVSFWTPARRLSCREEQPTTGWKLDFSVFNDIIFTTAPASSLKTVNQSWRIWRS